MLSAVIILSLLPVISHGCAATSSVSTTTVAAITTTAPVTTTSVAATTPTTTVSTTTSPGTTTSSTTTTTTTTTSTTTEAGPNCGSCPQNLMQGMQMDGAGFSDAVAIFGYTFDANGCIIPSVQCLSTGGSYQITMFLQEAPDEVFANECATANMPPGIITCNAMGQWVSPMGMMNPVIVCSQISPDNPEGEMC